MKKLFCLLAITIIACSSVFASIRNTDLTNSTYMKNQGYSDESIRLINEQIYTPLSTKKVHKPTIWQKFNTFIDPAYDSGKFGNKNIEFTNRYDEI